jgi:hypothetical protein
MKMKVILASLLTLMTIGLSIIAQGMMGGSNGYGRGGQAGGMMGGGMMGSWDYIPLDADKALSIGQAAEQTEKYLAAWGDNTLAISEIMEFSNHFYIEVGEKGSELKAFELLMNKYTGAYSRSRDQT